MSYSNDWYVRYKPAIQKAQLNYRAKLRAQAKKKKLLNNEIKLLLKIDL